MVGEPAFLVVEDDAWVGRAIARTLSPYGSSDVVDTVRAACAALDVKRFEAIVVDVGLPDGDGLEVLAAARSIHPAIDALILSGYADQRRLAEAHALSAHYLLKPFDPAQLVRFATRVLERRRGQVSQVQLVLGEWTGRYDLTNAEAQILELAVLGVSRPDIPDARGVAPSTIKKQVQNLLGKTGDTSLESAASRVLRLALATPKTNV